MSDEANNKPGSTNDSPQRVVLPTVLPLPAALRVPATGAVGPALTALDALTVGFEVEPTTGEAALERVTPLTEAIPENEVVPRLNTNVRNAAITALGAHERIIAIRPDALVHAPHHNLIYLDNFKDITLAMLHTDTAVQMSIEDKKDLAGMAEVLYAKRDQFSSLARGLARFGQLDARQLEVVGTEAGYKALARDASILVAVFRHNWDRVGKGLPFTQQDLAQLDREATALNVAIGRKEQNADAPREATLQRRRMFTLFRMAVEDIRRLAVYLYGEDAVDQIVPNFSNFAKGSGRSTKDEDETTTSADTATGTTAATGTTTTGAAATTSAQQRPSGFVVNNPENLPITNPFIEEDDGKKETA